MARASVSISSGDFIPTSGTISSQFFGGNFLFDRDRIGEVGTFDEKAEALNIDFIRYPGGTIAEQHFDLTDPDRSAAPDARAEGLMPLSEFLGYVAAISGTASIVLPTVAYMEGLRAGDLTAGAVRAEIRGFLRALEAGDYGDASAITHLEIGNEYYFLEGFGEDLAEAYAEIARIYAAEIEAIFGDAVNISVQAGIDAGDNAVILDAFAGRDDLVDSVILHSYPWDLGQVYSHQDWKEGLAGAWTRAGLAETVFLSEWNISNQYQEDDGALIGSDRIEDGLARAVAAIEMAAGYIGAGFDFATVWPLQQNTRGDLGGDEGETGVNRDDKLSDDGLTPVGKAFQLMSEILPGMRMLDIDGRIDVDARVEDDRFESEALVQAFEDDEKLVIFVSAWEISSDAGMVDLTLDLGAGYQDYSVTTLTVLGDDFINRNVAPVTFTQDGLDADGAITVRLARDYEIKRIIVNKAPELAAAEPGAEALYGGAGADTLLAGDGDDVIHALGGDDFVMAETGDDRVFGGVGRDHVKGGAGGDRLTGQGDDDRIWGEDGFDFILGGAGSDAVFGGRGDDTARGGGGDDALKGGGGGDLLSGGGGDDRLVGGGGDDTMKGGGGDDMLKGGAGDDRLAGGGGVDRLAGGGGANVLTGGGGRDVFVADTGGETLVTDFEKGADRLAFTAASGFGDLDIRAHGDDTLIIGPAASLIVERLDPDNLTAGDFVF